MRRLYIVALAVAAIVLALVANANGAVSGFSDDFSGHTFNTREWCPTHNTYSQSFCWQVEASTAGHNHTLVFDPAQVAVNHGDLRESIVYDPYDFRGSTYLYRSGSINGHGLQAYGYGTFAARIHLPCKNGLIENWPAFWLNGTVGDWPQHGEIDIMEGLNGAAAGHYHYLGRDGKAHQVGFHAQGNFCGWHVYAVIRAPGSITWVYDGHQEFRVTSAQIGVPLATDLMYPVIDYNASLPQFCCGGPFANGAVMKTAWFTYNPLVATA